MGKRITGTDREPSNDDLSAVTRGDKTSGDPVRKAKKLTYREQKEWGTIEENILKAEEQVVACQAAMHDPAIMSDAAELQARSHVLGAAQVEVERLYARWTELDEKRTQTV